MLMRYTHWIIQHHKLVVVLSLLFVIAIGSGVKNLTTTSDFRVYFSQDNPQLVAYEKLEKTYGKQDSLVFLIQPTNNDIFTKDTLSLIWQLTEKSWDLPYSSRVNSLTNYQHTVVNGDDLTTDYLLNDVSELTPKKN